MHRAVVVSLTLSLAAGCPGGGGPGGLGSAATLGKMPEADDPAPPLLARRVGESGFYDLALRVGGSATRPKKAVVVSFFATWCKPCREELPLLTGLMNELACKQLDAVLVGTGEAQTEKNLDAFAREQRLFRDGDARSVPFSVLADPYGAVAALWGVRELPATFLVDGHGVVRRVWRRARSGFAAELRAEVRELVRPEQSPGQCTDLAPARRGEGGRLRPLVEVSISAADRDDAAYVRKAVEARLSGLGNRLVSETMRGKVLAFLKRTAALRVAGLAAGDSGVAMAKFLSAHKLVSGDVSRRENTYTVGLEWVELESGEKRGVKLVVQQRGESFEALAARAAAVFVGAQKQSVDGHGDGATEAPEVGTAVAVDGLPGATAVWVPPGTFKMGSTRATDPMRDDDEGPVTEVTLSRGLWLFQHEVTQGQFTRVMGYNPSSFDKCGKDCPVESLTWHEAAAFCNKLSGQERACYDCKGRGREVTCQLKAWFRGKGQLRCKGWRLPTEAEWERAARAGTTTALYTGKLEVKGEHNAPALDPIAWYGGNSGVSYDGGYDCSGWAEKQYSATRCGTFPVGKKQENAYGLHDMLGNVWEWCGDWYADKYPGGRAADPTGPANGASRVLRCGSWFYNARLVRSAYRYWYTPANRYSNVGFRPASSK